MISAPLETNSELLPRPALHGVPGKLDTSRILGYEGLVRFGIKQDFHQRKLMKVIGKIYYR